MSTSSIMHGPCRVVAIDCKSSSGQEYTRLEIYDDTRGEMTIYTDADFIQSMVKALLFRERFDYSKED